MLSKLRCISCKNEITWQTMLKPTLKNYYGKVGKIVNCPNCKKELAFNDISFLISHILFCVSLGLALFFSDLPGFLVILIGLLALGLLGMPIERFLNVFFTLFFPLQLNKNEISPKD